MMPLSTATRTELPGWPAVWTSGALTFRASPDGSSYLPFVDVNNAAITITAPAAGKKNRTVILENRNATRLDPSILFMR
jgi:hypothetical protein